MTDYQPLLARAISGLERNTGEARRAIYDRARQALLNQLRAVNPPLAETDITRERLALEDAIRKIETQAAQANPELVRAARAPAASPPVAPRAPAPTPTVAAAPREAVSAAAQPRPAAPIRPPVMGAAEPRMPAPPAARGGPPPRDFNRSLPRAPQARPTPPRETDTEDAKEDRPQRENYANAQSTGRTGGMRKSRENIEFPLEEESVIGAELPRGAPDRADQSPMSPGDFAPGPRSRRLQPGSEARSRPEGRGGLRARLVVGGLVILLLAVAVLLAYLYRDRMLALLGVGPSGSQVASDPDKPKANDRVSPQVSAPPRSPAPASQPDAAPMVGQAATLYEENPGGAQQFQNFPGTVVWRTENVSVGPGRASDLALRIEIEIPDRKMNVSILLRRNMDASFPASHTLEIQFSNPGDPFGGISNVKGMRAKNAEAANGSVLFLSEPEKIKEGDILFALPDTQLEQNVQLLRERPWFDIAFFYNNGRRGVLAFEKGTPGERAINDALAAWGQGG